MKIEQGYKPRMIPDIKTGSFEDNYYKDTKYYCSKCKYYKDRCTLKRVVRICRKKRLRNVPIQENK
jgi:hypothetical protein